MAWRSHGVENKLLANGLLTANMKTDCMQFASMRFQFDCKLMAQCFQSVISLFA
jgi:hypothetical protein